MTDDQTSRVDLTGQSSAPEPPGPPAGAQAPTPAHSLPPAQPLPPSQPPASGQPSTQAPPAPETTPDQGASTAAVGGPGGGSRTRWAVALAVAGGAIALAVAAFLLLGAPQTPEALRYIPADSAVVVELRPELPGDQMQKLGNLLAHFPGFQDQSTLTDKLDEAMSRLVDAATEADVDFRQDIKPWLNGPMYVAAEAPEGGAGAGEPALLVSATTNGAVSCDTVMNGLVVEAETYRGLQIQKGTGPDFHLPVDDPACVVDARQVLIGSVASVKAAIDAKADSVGMDRSESYRAAREALTGDQLATFYVDGAAVRDGMPVPSFGTDLPIPGLGALGGFGQVPDWLVSGIRAEDDALVFDTVAAPLPTPTGGPSLLPVPPPHDSEIARLLPPNTIFFVENQGTGVELQNLLARLRAMPDLAGPLAMLDGMGGAGELVGWVEDAGLAVIDGPTSPTLGVLLVATDDDAAAARVATLKSVLGFAGLGGGITVTDSTVAGVAVTTVTVTDVGALVPPGTIPGGVPVPADAEVSFSIAAKGRVLYLGLGDQVMTALLAGGQSLVDQAVYQRATARDLDAAGTSGYIAVQDIIGLVEGFLPEEARSEWETDIRPYLAPIHSVSFSTSSSGTATRSRLVLTIATP